MIEIMIVVLILGILLAIAVPNFVRARATSRLKAIEENLREIDGCKSRWAIDHNEASNAPVTPGDLAPAYQAWPTGPVVGNYAVTTVDANATFDGGNKGPMDWTTWDQVCVNDPASCGL